MDRVEECRIAAHDLLNEIASWDSIFADTLTNALRPSPDADFLRKQFRKLGAALSGLNAWLAEFGDELSALHSEPVEHAGSCDASYAHLVGCAGENRGRAGLRAGLLQREPRGGSL